MASPLSLDLRERIAAAVCAAEESHPLIAERFGVSVSTVERISRKLRAGASLEPAPRSGRPCVLGDVHFEYLREQLERDPYVSSYELVKRFNKSFPKNRVHRSTVLRGCISSASASKKTPYAPQRDRPDVVAEREAFFVEQPGLDVARFVVVDEAGSHPGQGPRRGWAPRGQPLYGPEQTHARGKHVSMIAALRLDGVCALMTVDGGVKTKHFLRFVTQRLAPVLRPGDIVCWDNINMHKNAKVIAAVEATGAKVLRLPRYSPDLNPIEAGWAKVKAFLRRVAPETVSELKDAMRRGLRRIRPTDAAGWIRYCGYSLPYF